MNTNRPEDSEVAELPEALSGELLILKAAYRAAEQRDAEPSSAIDDALRAAARRAVNAGPGEVPLTRSFFHFPTLATPLAAAAVMVLAVSVGFLSMNEPFMQRHLQPEPPMAVSVVRQGAESAKAPAEAPAAVLAEKAGPDASAKPAGANESGNAAVAPTRAAARDAGPADRASAGTAKSAAAAAAPAPATAPAPAPAFAPAASAAPPMQKDEPAKADRALSATAPKPAEPASAQPGATPSASGRMEASTPVMARAASAPPPAASPSPLASPAPPAPVSAAPLNRDIVLADSNDPRLKGLAKRERYEQPATEAAPAVAAKPAAPVTTQNASIRSSSEEKLGENRAVAARPTPQPAKPAEAARSAELVMQFDEANPKAWLDGIVRMKSAGMDKQVAEQLKRFRERYPDHPLPEVLREKK